MKNVFLILFLILGGCANNPSNPVIKDQIMNVGTLATDASRRVVLVTTTYDKDKLMISTFCAEPSPDVSIGVLSTLQTAVEGAVKINPTSPDIAAKVDIDKSIQTAMQGLFTRTQGVQLFRDGLFNLCIDYVNGAMTPDDYKLRYDALLDKASELIKLELTLLYSTK